MKWRYVPTLLGLMMVTGGARAEAQLGPVIDWITKLSGPGVIRTGPQYTFALSNDPRAPEVSVSALFGFKSRDGDGPDGDASVNLLSGQTTLDVPVVVFSPNVSLLAVGGVAGHAFLGDDFDTFGTISFPLQGALRVRTGGSVTLRFGAGVNVIRFPGDAFDPIDVGVDRDSWEAAFGTQFAVLFRV